MNTKLTVILAAIIAVVTSTSSRLLAEDNSVVGEWVPATTSKGGLGATRTFDKNGTAVVSFGAAVHVTYKLEANTVVLTSPDGTSQRMDFAITNDTLTLTVKDEPSQTLTRVKGTEGKGIVGKWTGKHSTGKQQVMDFTTKMNCYLSVPFQSETGTFAIVGNTLTEKFQNKDKDKTWNWKIADGVLTLADPSTSKTDTFKRKE
jgi:hypothetical protein